MAFLKIGFILEYFQAHRKTELNVQSFHKTPYHFPCTTYPIIHRPHHSRVQRRVDEPTLTNHCITVTQSSKYTLGFTVSVLHSMGLDEFLMICIYHCGVIQNSSTALKSLCVSKPVATNNLFFLSLQFNLFQNFIQLESYNT